MKSILLTIIVFLAFLTLRGAMPEHLEPAGFGPFEEGRVAARLNRIADLFQLENNVEGFRFMVLCINDDGRATFKIVREDADGSWWVHVRLTNCSVDIAKSKDVMERTIKMNADAGKAMYSEIISALRDVAYNGPPGKELTAFSTGGVETYVAARPENTFLAGRIWNPPAGTRPYRIQEIALKLGNE